ncbi:MAG: hypothetical protein ACKVUS_04125, partial [Saprospiraceae bacterium]
ISNQQSTISNQQSTISNQQSTISNQQSTISNQQSTISNQQSANLPINNLPVPLTPVALPERIFAPRKVPVWAKEPIANKVEPVKSQRLSLGLSLAGSAYQPDSVGRWAGWAVGFFGDYRLNKNVSLSLGAHWRFVPGGRVPAAAADSSKPNVVDLVRYSFGFQREQWQRKTQGLHYLEVPLSARWHKGSWGMEGGGAAGWLLGVQNRVTHTSESSLGGKTTEVKKFVKGDAAPYNQAYFSAFVGAEYRLNSRLALMARGQYRFTPVARNIPDAPRNKGLGNVDLGLRVRLF